MSEAMIRYLSQDEKQETRFLYEISFPEDTKEFVDYYYESKLRDNEILVMEEQDILQVMLHLNPFNFSVCQESVKLNYVVAVATNEAFRRQGKMTRVMKQALEDMTKNHMPFTFLIPANPAVYRSFGFVFVPAEEYYEAKKFLQEDQKVYFEKSVQAAEFHLSLQEATKEDIINMVAFSNEFLEEKYDIFPCRSKEYYNRIYKELDSQNGKVLLIKNEEGLVGTVSYGREKDRILIQEILIKEEYQEELILRLTEYFTDETIEITEMNYMIRILDLKVMGLLLRSQRAFSLKVKVRDSLLPMNEGCYEIRVNETESSISSITENETECVMEITELTEFLFGKMKIHIREWV